MSDGVRAARRRKLRCRMWSSHAVWRCSYTPATEPVLQSKHDARSVISHSGAAPRSHHGTWSNQDMEPKGDFFLKNHPAKFLHWASRESLSLGICNALVEPRGWQNFFPRHQWRNLPEVPRPPPPTLPLPGKDVIFRCWPKIKILVSKF